VPRRLLNVPYRVAKTIIISVLFIGSQKAWTEPANSPRTTQRSFIFLWPGQQESARQLELTAPIVTDRPSFTDSSRTVGTGVTQAELGYTYSYDGSTSPHTASHTYPELSLRQGIFQDWLELRLLQGLTTSDTPGTNYSGFNDLETGLRFGITPQSGFLPELSITPHLRLPTGSTELRGHRTLLGIVASYSWAVSADTSLAGSTQGVQEETDQEHSVYGEWTQSLIATTFVSSETSLWAECYGIFPASQSGLGEAYYADAGISYLLGLNMQLDVRVGSRLQDSFGQEIFTGVGVSVRYL
jgi:hypothetical protein